MIYVTHRGVRAQHRLDAEHERLHIKIIERLAVNGGSSSSRGCRGGRLLAEAEYAELIGDEVQIFEAEGLGWREDG